MTDDEPVTITIRRRVKGGRELEFEESLREFVPQSLRFPGHLGVLVLKAAPEWVVVIKFQRRSDYDAFRDSPEYQRWTAHVSDLLEAEPDAVESSGLESWFTLPGESLASDIPRWKIAIVTWLGVNVAVIATTYGLWPVVGDWPFIPQCLVVNAVVVVLLTWLIMPLLTRYLRFWLNRPKPNFILQPLGKASHEHNKFAAC